jgi:hypothetical protein
MDVIIYSEPEELSSLLESLGFRVIKRSTYYDAKLKCNHGRIHILFRNLNNNMIYCDIHYDNPIHFMKFGVDYKYKPSQFYENVLQIVLKSKGIKSKVIGGFRWSDRKNKAIIMGLKL